MAAIVTSAEASYPDHAQARTIAAANLPVWATHNQGDPDISVNYTIDYINMINEAPAPNPPAEVVFMLTAAVIQDSAPVSEKMV